ncbi:MAG: ketoacyl-ACP synthase III [Negativicutes bacterium]|nr:ketoacyl-ACP synthase III [Negativicutes bacterium]
MMIAGIAGTAMYLPEQVVRNEDMVQFPARFRNAIADKAGIFARRHIAPGQVTSDLGVEAVERLLQATGVLPQQVEALICATSSPDRLIPATATRIQEKTSLVNAFAFDVNSACSGGVYALRLAAALVADGVKHVVVVAAEAYSQLMNPKDITTYTYFGDGAAAALVTPDGPWKLKGFHLGSDGSKADSAQAPAGGTRLPGACVTRVEDFYLTMKGKDIFDFAVKRGPETIEALKSRFGRPDRFICHQANRSIIAEISKRTGEPMERFFLNLSEYGNTAGASTLIAFHENLLRHPEDQSVVMVAFGAGLSWGGSWLEKV